MSNLPRTLPGALFVVATVGFSTLMTFGTRTSAVAEEVLIDCPPPPVFTSGGDRFSRGFYIPSFAGRRLIRVALWMRSPTNGSSMLYLRAQKGGFDGEEIATAMTFGDFAGGADPVRVWFPFYDAEVTPGSLIAFSLSLPPAAKIEKLYYMTPTADVNCPVIQTEGTSAPLSQFRRSGIPIRVDGELCAPPLTVDAFDGGSLGRTKSGALPAASVGPYFASRDDNPPGTAGSSREFRNYHEFDLSDPVALLSFLFHGGRAPGCARSSWAARALPGRRALFLGGAPIAAPFRECGTDRTRGRLPDCERSSC